MKMQSSWSKFEEKKKNWSISSYRQSRIQLNDLRFPFFSLARFFLKREIKIYDSEKNLLHNFSLMKILLLQSLYLMLNDYLLTYWDASKRLKFHFLLMKIFTKLLNINRLLLVHSPHLRIFIKFIINLVNNETHSICTCWFPSRSTSSIFHPSS